jgi:hypothetical protein
MALRLDGKSNYDVKHRAKRCNLPFAFSKELPPPLSLSLSLSLSLEWEWRLRFKRDTQQRIVT